MGNKKVSYLCQDNYEGRQGIKNEQNRRFLGFADMRLKFRIHMKLLNKFPAIRNEQVADLSLVTSSNKTE